jgi:uncharacterized protein YjbJ (UPF0337 family)
MAGGDLMWNKDEMRGKTDHLKGAVKKAVGDLVDDEELRKEGEADEAAGNVEQSVGEGRRKIGNAIKDIGDKIGH